MMNSDEAFAKAKEEEKRLSAKVNRLEIKVLQCQSKTEEDALQMEKDKERIEDLEKDLKES